jgi:hypothetical protein
VGNRNRSTEALRLEHCHNFRYRIPDIEVLEGLPVVKVDTVAVAVEHM